MGIKSDDLHLYQKHQWKLSLWVLTLLYSCTCWGKSVRKHDLNTRVVHAAPCSSASIENTWPLPQLPHDVPIRLFCASNLARRSGILAVCIFWWVLFHQNMQATGPLARDQEYCWMRLQPPFSGRLTDFQKEAELTAGSARCGVVYYFKLWQYETSSQHDPCFSALLLIKAMYESFIWIKDFSFLIWLRV